MLFNHLVTLASLGLIALSQSVPSSMVEKRENAVAAKKLNPWIDFHDADGNVVGGRNLTSAEVEMWFAQQNATDVAKRDGTYGPIEKRDQNDIFYWQDVYSFVTCASGDCTWQYFYNVVIAHEGVLDCSSPTVANYRFNPCYQAVTLKGTWYWVDNCNGDAGDDWSTKAPGSFLGNLLTWNNAYVGGCYATSHSSNYKSCRPAGTWSQDHFTSLAKCNVP